MNHDLDKGMREPPQHRQSEGTGLAIILVLLLLVGGTGGALWFYSRAQRLEAERAMQEALRQQQMLDSLTEELEQKAKAERKRLEQSREQKSMPPTPEASK